eukprot:CAMPEP_0167784586 /NCGR_PEP_ID=MMETSP0111_2-20121227/7722_1 /TAXON_ID=91324 /ORGANISM="Lotharella globosa, Strain CCCM811" /LENGTH=97 /DNA_ID=CAMNT_0007675679 /DNA_START=632 /DNA_END=925 /DNA_ORIENTATION=-
MEQFQVGHFLQRLGKPFNVVAGKHKSFHLRQQSYRLRQLFDLVLMEIKSGEIVQPFELYVAKARDSVFGDFERLQGPELVEGLRHVREAVAGEDKFF